MTFSQNSYQITDTTKKWNTVSYGFGPWSIACSVITVTNKIGEQQIIYDSTFFKVYEAHDSLQEDWYQIGYLREDTTNKKVYFAEDEWFGKVGLIYDFGLLEGDSVIIDNFCVGFEDVLLICDSIDSLSVNGRIRKRFFLSNPYGDLCDVWLEGIGSKYGLLNSGYGGSNFTGGGADLLCCSKNDTIIYMDTIYNSCYISEFYPKIVSESFDTAYLNTFYEFQLQISDTINIDSFALIGDVIPEGFEFNEATGVVSGMPTSVGSFCCIITMANYDINFLTDILYSDINVVLPTTIKNEPKQSEIKIYPNPFSSYFSISWERKLLDFYYLKIFDCEGKLIDKKTITKSNFTINCSNYKNGIYLLKITDNNHKIFKIEKIMKN